MMDMALIPHIDPIDIGLGSSEKGVLSLLRNPGRRQ